MNRYFKLVIFLFIAGFTTVISAQSTDLARVEYTYFPQSNSDNSFRRFKSFLNFPIKLTENDAYLVPGVEYENINLKYADPAFFDTRELERFQTISASLGYTFKINEEWRFAVDGGVQIGSNFETGTLISDDMIYTGTIFMIKIKEDERYIKPWRLVLGLSYSTTYGQPFPLPYVNYFKQFHPKWSYALGVPKTNVRYYLTDKHVFQGYVTMDGFFANVQNNFAVNQNPDSPIADSVSMTIVLSGLGYSYNFTDNLSFYTYAGYTIWNDIRFRDTEMENVYTINETNSFYARAGLKFSIL